MKKREEDRLFSLSFLPVAPSRPSPTQKRHFIKHHTVILSLHQNKTVATLIVKKLF